ncbi:histone-lysine N-methyltransferase, H3 lysine-79 specific-like isoform X2 [Panonychus citri]|uniref:histone-lysine N-methyltransferase, H3 lysine-79 specific-like isoform X2 n=1 Tax=Panonychus citri TaxID=50023 RepID=UPI002307B0D4|nr:histone-lysine N-methyltransferase, H3 lysine-79 specific-like isoform X2 [Panonychus citri]
MPGSLLETINSNSKSDEEKLKSSQRSATRLSPFSPTPSVQLKSNNYNRNNNNQLISSARSDRSDGSNCDSEGGGSTSTTTSTSNKKVSFNKAVRVKKYSSPPTHSGDLSESKFWFRVHKANNCDHLNNNQLNQQQLIPTDNQQQPQQPQQQQRHQQLPSTDHSIQSLPSKGSPLSNSVNCDSHCETVNGNQPLIESEFKSSSSTTTSPLNKSTTSIGDITSTTMPPISSSRKNGVKIIDYSVDDQSNGGADDGGKMSTSKGSEIDNHSNLKSTSGKSTQRIINYEPYKSASTIALDIDSSLRPRSPSPVSKTGRHSSVDSASRKVNPTTANNNNNIIVTNSIRPGSVVSEEIIETKTVEKKNPLLSGVKVMFGVKAKRAPTFPTMPNRSKSVDRTNNSTTIKPITTNKTTATIVRPTFASRTTSSTLKSRDSPQTNSSTLRSRQSESTNQPLKSSLTTSRNPPLTSSLKKTQAPTPSKNVRDLSASRVTTKSPPSLVSSEINKLMSTVSTTKKQPSPSTTLNDEVTSKKEMDLKGDDYVDTVEMARERPADRSTGDLTPVSTWNSGPVLISNVANKETSSSYIPGEGKLMASFEEGTKVWKSKSRRVYEEPIKIPRETSVSPERHDSISPERLTVKSKSPDRQSSSSRNQSPDRLYRKHQSRKGSPTRDEQLSQSSIGKSRLRSISPERPSSSAGYRSQIRHRSPSPIMIERKSPATTPITVDIEEDAIDGGGLKKSNRTRFSPTHETFYRSSSSISDNHKSLPTADDLDENFLRKEVYLNDREPDHVDHDDLIVDYTPKMEDKACQCNLKRSSKYRGKEETDSLCDLGYRVIKPATDGSVSTFSNVPDISDAETEIDRQSNRPMSRDGSPIVDRRSPQTNHHHHHHRPEVIYSQIDRTKKRSTNQSSPLPPDDYLDHHNLDQPGEYGPDDYLYESNAIKSARSSVSPSRGENTRRSMETSSYRHQSPSPSPSRRYMFEIERQSKPDLPSPSPRPPNKTVSVAHKTYGFNMRTALEAPEVHLPTRPPSTKPVRVIEAPYHHHQPQQHPYHPHDELMSRSTGGRLERMRDENLSGDELIHNRRGSISDPDDLIAPKSIIREIDHRKGEINYENVTPRNRSTGIRGSIYEDGQSTNNSMWFRSLEDDYRKGLSDRESFNNNINHHPHHHHDPSNHTNVTDYCTMSRRGRDRLPSSRDVGADYHPPSTMTHAYTLDRRHLDRAQRSKRPGQGYSTAGSHLGISSPSMSINGHNGLTSSANNNSPSMAMRKYNSTRDLSHLHSQSDFIDNHGSTRGGLAAAYKARQRRASSLSRFGQSPNGGYHLPGSPSSNLYPRTSHSVLSSSNYPLHSGSHSQLHRLHLTGSEIGGYHPHHYPSHHHPLRSSASHIGASYGHSSCESDAGLGSHQRTISGSRSRLNPAHHQNDPVVLYIPAISHHNRPVDEDDRNSALGIARTQSILSTSKRTGLSSKNKKRDESKDRDSNFNEITSKVNGYLNNNNNNKKNNNSEKNQITSTGLMNEGDDEIIELRDDEDEDSNNNNNNKMNGKKKDVKRSVSIPKDTKLPWLQKLKMKVKA